MADSPSSELEKLQDAKRELVNKLVKVEEQEKTLRESIELLKEKIAVRDLQEKIKEKEKDVASLSLERNSLEERLKEPSKPSNSSIVDAIQRTKEQIEDTRDKSEASKKRKFF